MLRFEKDINNECLQYFAVSTPNALLIKSEDNVVGMIDYEVKGEYVKIFYITIAEEYKRQGYATEVIVKIINENKGKYLYGDALPGAAMKFWESMGAEFDEDDDDYLTPFHINC